MTFLIYVCALVGITACCFTIFVGLIRLEQSLANEGFLPAFFSGKDQPNGISVKGTIFTTVVISLIAVFQSLVGISQLVSVVNLVTYSFVCACCLAFRYKKQD
jgi:amino acid transporter